MYEILVFKYGLMGVYEMLDVLKEIEFSVKFVIVYCVLDFLLDFGLIYWLELNKVFVVCYYFGCKYFV